jgi:hypothetical protein
MVDAHNAETCGECIHLQRCIDLFGVCEDDKPCWLLWKKYRKTGVQEMRPYIPGENLAGVSVSERDTPEEGGMIARDVDDGAEWYVSARFFQDNYTEVVERAAPRYPWHKTESDLKPSPGDLFVKHIKQHLNPGEHVCCKICGKTVEEIATT